MKTFLEKFFTNTPEPSKEAEEQTHDVLSVDGYEHKEEAKCKKRCGGCGCH